MQLLENPYFGKEFPGLEQEVLSPSTDAPAVAKLLSQCPAHKQTPLVVASDLVAQTGVASVSIKDERERMGLGSFKALGAAYVIACDAQNSGAADLNSALRGSTYVTASAGNHGISVAAGARIFGADAVIYLSETVPTEFAERLKAKGAQVVVAGHNYEASMEAAKQGADENGWILLSDSSWPGYIERPHRLMEGYLQLAQETAEQMDAPPTHVFLQAGVGGFAGAIAALLRKHWGQAPCITVVEPEFAPALFESVKAGKVTVTQGPVSDMGRLDCKEPSLIAIKGLGRDANFFCTLTEAEAKEALAPLQTNDLATSTSGAAGFAALLASQGQRATLGIDENSSVLCFITEESGT